jgi:UDP-N-acetylglucosamine--N-acetylmuramyl-(pentapeptide) pyrophosphoryl-undecaprenol N-acetylglucosamine transferase
MSRTLMIMAGGTGGHVMPGLAVADEMRARSWQVVWLGVPGGLEAELVPSHGIPMRWVRIGGLRGKSLATRLLAPWRLARALWQALRVLREIRPAVVLGLGGYVAFPGGVMAALTGRPLVIHEQNSIAGLTNRVLARFARRVLVAFPGALAGAQWCGNPVRASVAGLPPPEERMRGREGPLRLLVVGGSLGAKALNDAVPAALAQIPPQRRPLVVHQSGKAHIDALRATYEAAGVEADVRAFIDDMASEYGRADLVICRAGAMTVSELAAAGVASVLVPYPHAVDDHQTTNARFLADRDAAVLLPQGELEPRGLAALLEGMDRGRLLAMAVRARELARPHASRELADACEAVARDGR